MVVVVVVVIFVVVVVGTLRPDLIESASELASGSADTIKTHHNDTDLVRQLRQQVFTYLFTASLILDNFTILSSSLDDRYIIIARPNNFCCFRKPDRP